MRNIFLSFLAASFYLLASCSPKSSCEDPQIVIDSTLQSIVAHHVSSVSKEIQPQWGLGILLDMQSNTICANYSTDTTQDYAYTPMQLGTLMEPFTLLAILNTGKVPLDTIIPEEIVRWRTSKTDGSKTKKKQAVMVALPDLVASSDGYVINNLLHDVYSESVQELEAFYTTIGLPDRPDSLESISMSLLHRRCAMLDIAPVKALSLYAQLALRQLPCDTAAQRIICQGLHDVVWNDELGTASINPWGSPKAQSNIVPIAGKTGAISIYEDGEYNPRRHLISFVGYFPEDDPRYACLVMFNAPSRFPYDAGTNCGGCVRKIAEDISQDSSLNTQL